MNREKIMIKNHCKTITFERCNEIIVIEVFSLQSKYLKNVSPKYQPKIHNRYKSKALLFNCGEKKKNVQV